ncbi:MAG: diaminopimelate decarboxylase [Candidatus Gastranaerophilales bacterium]|nr:diaminopimelate decarboxylase [Candidatus Gastranaerophilales bacterium]
METANQNIKPVTTRINDNGCIEIGGCDLTELADTYGTPLYVYDEETIRSITRSYKDAFRLYPNIKMMFASKAFMTKAICKVMEQEGFGLDLCSGGEIYTALSSGFDMSKTLFNGNNKSYDELVMAINCGIGTISVDNFFELELLNNVAVSSNKKVRILLRITPGIECHTHEYIQTGHLDSKFGFDLTQADEAVELIKEQYKNLELVGLHAHIGSQIFEKQVYYDEVGVLFKEIKHIQDKYGITLHEINLGGGVGIKYTEQDKPVSIYEIANVIIESIEAHSKEYKIEAPSVFIEPGRSIVGTAGVTLYTAGSSKQVPNGRKYQAVDGGMADNARPSLYQAKYTVEIANNPHAQADTKVTIAGRFCESGDILAKDIMLPDINEGDIICFYDTGAYGYSMSSNYNRVLKPAVVLVNNGKSDIIINRQTYEQLTESDLIPKRLDN